MARQIRGPKKLERLGRAPMSREEEQRADQMIAEAERQVSDQQVNFRWGKDQLDLIKWVASQIGIPYQTYMKDVLYRQALKDRDDIQRGS